MTERPTTGSEKLRRRRKEKSAGHVLQRRSTKRQVSKKISQNKAKPVVAAEIDRVLRFASGASWKPDPRLRGRVWAHDPMIAAWASYKSRGTEPVVVPIGRTGWYAWWCWTAGWSGARRCTAPWSMANWS